MVPIPDLVPISDLRLRQSEVLAKLENGPVILTQHSRARAVLMDYDAWRRLMEELEDMDDALTSLETRATDDGTRVPLEDVLVRLGMAEKELSA
jgi:prevent-host-death family protein